MNPPAPHTSAFFIFHLFVRCFDPSKNYMLGWI
jgi:hypothetical protein